MKEDQIPIHKIEKLNTQIITLIRQSEIELKDIKSHKMETGVDNKVRDNVHYSLAIKLRE